MAGTVASFDLESDLLARGARLVAGVDEAGRGPLAGPVVTAAVILDAASAPRGLADSKMLSQPVREALFARIIAVARVSIAVASPLEIDRLNIRGATLAAMSRAVAGLTDAPCHVLVDGRDRPACTMPATAVIDGDAISASIAAASIIAKVARDRLMVRLSRSHPGYGFERHKGYSTPQHMDALGRLGPCPAHRRSFAPVAQARLALECA